MYHLMFTVQPRSVPDRKRPSNPWVAADSSSVMSKIWDAIHSPRCPAVTGLPMILAMLASMLLRSCRSAAIRVTGSSTPGSIAVQHSAQPRAACATISDCSACRWLDTECYRVNSLADDLVAAERLLGMVVSF